MADGRHSKTGRKQGWGMRSSPQIQTPSAVNRNTPPPGTAADEGEGGREEIRMETAAAEEEEIMRAKRERGEWGSCALGETGGFGGAHLSSTQHKRNG